MKATPHENAVSPSRPETVQSQTAPAWRKTGNCRSVPTLHGVPHIVSNSAQMKPFHEEKTRSATPPVIHHGSQRDCVEVILFCACSEHGRRHHLILPVITQETGLVGVNVLEHRRCPARLGELEVLHSFREMHTPRASSETPPIWDP